MHANMTQKPVAFETADKSDGETEPSSEDSEDYDSDDPTAELIRETKREVAAERKSHKPQPRQSDKSPRGPRKPVDEDMSLHGLSSLSGDHKPRDMSNVECFKCGQKGHMQSDCPKPRGSAGRGRGRGRR
jgi:hypothetical protein